MSTADIVNDWARERLATAPLARDTEAYNQVFTALPYLIARLDADAAPATAAADPTIAAAAQVDDAAASATDAAASAPAKSKAPKPPAPASAGDTHSA